MDTLAQPATRFDPATTTRPDPALQQYYLIVSLMSLVAFPFVIVPLLLKYRTLQYRFDDKGVSMAWGILFRKEIYLTYRRIQDIHVSRNIIQRWMGLASVSVQTASGSAGAEMTIEGILDPEGLRDFLYRQMRGAREGAQPQMTAEGAGEAAEHPEDEAIVLLRSIHQDLQALRSTLETRP